MLDYLQNLALADWVRSSPSIFAYTTVLTVHAVGLAIVVGEVRDGLLVLAGLLPIVGADVVTEYRGERALEALREAIDDWKMPFASHHCNWRAVSPERAATSREL